MSPHTIHTRKSLSHRESSLPAKWEKSEDTFSSNDLIDAYLNGVQYGMDEQKRILMDQFKENVDLAATLSETLYEQLLTSKLKPIEVHLKADSITNFTALFVVELSDYLSDDFQRVYTMGRKLYEQNQKNNFCLSFSFTPNLKDLNEHCLVADGFFIRYEKK